MTDEALVPTISVVIATRDGWSSVGRTIEALVPQVRAAGGEIVVVDGSGEQTPSAEPVRWISIADRNLLRLRLRAIREARGNVVAIGEDHAVPEPGWCDAVLRAHAEHPRVPVVVGCLVNATHRTVAGRANFLAFAAPYSPPMPTLPAGRPPPVSTLSFKRSALDGLDDTVGRLETEIIPNLYATGQMVADDRIRFDHYQDHGLVWSVRNVYSVTRAAYGSSDDRSDPERRKEVARWLITKAVSRHWRDARVADGVVHRTRDLAAVAVIVSAVAVGGVVGTYLGPGRAADRIA